MLGARLIHVRYGRIGLRASFPLLAVCVEKVENAAKVKFSQKLVGCRFLLKTRPSCKEEYRSKVLLKSMSSTASDRRETHQRPLKNQTRRRFGLFQHNRPGPDITALVALRREDLRISVRGQQGKWDCRPLRLDGSFRIEKFGSSAKPERAAPWASATLPDSANAAASWNHAIE